MAADTITALAICKSRMNRLAGDTSLDVYLGQRISAAVLEFTRKGIILTADLDDTVLLADYVVWRHNNRDAPGGTPEWLRLALRERFISPKGRDTT